MYRFITSIINSTHYSPWPRHFVPRHKTHQFTSNHLSSHKNTILIDYRSILSTFDIQNPNREPLNKNSFRILLVDDEPDILEFVGYNLMREGYRVEKAESGKQAIQLAREFLPHLIILDVMMPDMDGMETCTTLLAMEELKNPLIVFLTARGEDYSQIAGFEAGADDYITKPIKPRILLSRIQALLRRYKEQATEESAADIMETTDFVIDKAKYVVIRDGHEISLPKKEFELLCFLVSSPNKVVTRDDIFSSVWGNDVIVGDRTIDVHIRRIRERLGIDSIKTVKGVGYKFEEK